MQLAHTFLAFGFAASLAHASFETDCGPLSTVTVTVTAPPTSLSLALVSSIPVEAALTDNSEIDVTATLSSTTFLTNTKIVSAAIAPVPLPSPSDASEDGNYYFAEQDGTTSWLGGKTPTSGATFVTYTTIISIQPQPATETSIEGTGLEEVDGTTTSTSTLTTSATSFYTHYLTKALTLEPASTLAPSERIPPYLGSHGWNATLTRVQSVKSEAMKVQLTDAYTLDNLAWSGSNAATATVSYDMRRHHPRQVGAVVSATINGMVVSWTNSYGGEPSVTDSLTSIETSIFTVAATSSEPLGIPGYTWNTGPILSTYASAQSTSSAAQQTSTQAAPKTSSITASSSKQSSQATAHGHSSIGTSTQISSHVVSLTASALPSFNSTQTGEAASATASSCGNDTGRFMINFDDLPHFSTASPLSDIPPIFNPYNKLFFNGGYGYVPPPSDPYAPLSPPQLAVYNYHNDSVSQQSIDAGLELHGEIGAGPRVNESAYWIDAYSTWIGCANVGPSDCRIDFIGYDRFNAEIATQTLLQPPCPGLVNCKLVQVTFTSQFRDLAGLQILAYVNKTPVTFYMDDLSLGWSNNTCLAQLERSSGE